MHKKDFCSKLDWIGVTWNSEKKAVFNTGKLGIRGIQLNSLQKNKTSRKEIWGKTWNNGKNQIQMIPVSIQY